MKTKLLRFVLPIAICIYTETAFSQCYQFYGLSPDGGETNTGAIYKFSENGNIHVVSSFKMIEGYWPYGSLCKADNGKLYGMTSGGGKYFGVMFEWDPVTSEYSKKIDFDGEKYGHSPVGSLLRANNGKLYGMTRMGGSNNMGVIFEWDPLTSTYSKKFEFNGTESGNYPNGSLVQTESGLIYGMTSEGGENNCGVLFEWDPVSNIFNKMLDFDGDTRGKLPQGSLTVAENGKLYGITGRGGVNNEGVIFEWDPITNSYCKKYDFNGPESGRRPQSSLVQAHNGKLYGMTTYGGIYGFGVIFEWDPYNNAFSKKLDFDGTDNGSNPEGSLSAMENGKLIGMAGSVLFEWDPFTNSYNKKYELNSYKEGFEMHGNLVKANNDKFYGMTRQGGIPLHMGDFQFTSGVLFEWDPSTDTYSVKLKFRDAKNGSLPVNLVEADNGKLYGTALGGTNNFGVLFELNPETDTYTKKFVFPHPFPGKLIVGNNGKLYGYTSSGPEYSDGWTLYEWDPSTNEFDQHFSFNSESNVGRVNDLLIQADNEKVYGATYSGGLYNNGTIFEWDPATRNYAKKLDFNNKVNGGVPRLLAKARNGKLYGIARKQSLAYNGILFEWDPETDIYLNKLELSDSFYIKSFVQAQNGKFYGATILGTSLFEWDPETNAYVVKHKLNEIEIGSYLLGNLTLGDNGKLYGLISISETDKHYAYIEWDILNDTFKKISDFRMSDGGTLSGEFLIRNQVIKYTLSAEACESFKSPSGKVLTSSGVYIDTIPSSNGCDSIVMINLTINKCTTNTISQSACYSYISPSGKVWNTSGEYKDTITNAAGCDSIITVNLTIRKADASVTQNQAVLTANASEATYQWIDCGNVETPIEGESHQTFTATKDGNYAVIVTQNGCIDTSDVFPVIPTGPIATTFKHNITLYPNPSDGSFSIDLGWNYPKAEITITELDGRIIRKDFVLNKQIMDLQISASPGVYLVTVSAENERAIFKILKK
jgi:uncharacterized repeat protein (TIGR03803 family)